MAAALGVTARVDTPVDPQGAARASRSRRPVLLAIGAIALATLAFAATKLRPARESGQTVALPPAASKADSSAATVAIPPTDSATASAPATPAAADSLRIARAVRQGVFGVTSSAGRGTAFLVEASDGRGIALTSASVLPRDRSEPIELFLEQDRKVRGTLLTVDSASGVAALLVSLKSCSRCKALGVVPPDSAAQPVEGDTVVANPIGGRASHRPVRMALGKIGPKSLASSVRVTSANAGAPVLSTKSGDVAVVAIAAMNSVRGSGSAAFVPASVLRETVARAKSEQAAKALQPNDSLFWSWPVRTVDAGVIENARKRSAEDLSKYKTAVDGFALLAMTPQVMAWRAAKYGAAAAEANPFEIRITDPIDKWPAWNVYRSERRAVVVFQVTPKDAALPDFPSGVVDFKRGDFVSMQLLRDGQELLPIESERIPAVGNVKEYTDRKRDVYSAGVLVYHPFDFAPKSPGVWAKYEAVIVDARRHDKPTRIALTPAMLQAIAADLGDWQKR